MNVCIVSVDVSISLSPRLWNSGKLNIKTGSHKQRPEICETLQVQAQTWWEGRPMLSAQAKAFLGSQTAMQKIWDMPRSRKSFACLLKLGVCFSEHTLPMSGTPKTTDFSPCRWRHLVLTDISAAWHQEPSSILNFWPRYLRKTPWPQNTVSY